MCSLFCAIYRRSQRPCSLRIFFSRHQSSRLVFEPKSLFNITGTLVTEGIAVGSVAEVKHTFRHKDVLNFSKLCGDDNPVQIDADFAKKTIFGKTIVHGILVSSLFSTIFGHSVQGAIYVGQTLSFKRPVFVGSEVTASMKIMKMEEKRKGTLLTCCTSCALQDGSIAIEGEAQVLIPTQVLIPAAK